MTKSSTLDRYSINEEKTGWRVVDGEAVLINFDSTRYYSLNTTGTFVWNFIVDGERTESEIVEKVSLHYGVPEAEVRHDVLGILSELAEEGLLETR